LSMNFWLEPGTARQDRRARSWVLSDVTGGTPRRVLGSGGAELHA
jgi:hypothetical protein